MGTKKVVLIIVDISWYTRYMLINPTDALHANDNIRNLLVSMAERIDIPLDINKIEGDSILMYADIQLLEEMWGTGYPEELWKKISELFDIFEQKLLFMQQTGNCTCWACTNLQYLGLKAIIHAGTLSIQKILHFLELSGIDVITIHRLLKNSIASEKYILVTESGSSHVRIPAGFIFESTHEEQYDVGKIRSHVYFPISR